MQSDQAEVIGVAGDIKFRTVKRESPASMYVTVGQAYLGGAYTGEVRLLVRSQLPPAAVEELARTAVRNEGIAVEVSSADSLAEVVGASYRNETIRMQAASIFGLLALGMIVTGIYGLMAYSVARRTREIGLRMAVGATAARVMGLVVGESSRLVLIGVLIGIPAALAVMKAISSLAFGLEELDMVSVVAAAAILLTVGVVASISPARRAARLNPTDALRVQ